MKKITIGITGAVSASDMIDYLMALSNTFEINLILTKNAKNFITHQSVQYYVNEIYENQFTKSSIVDHINLAQECDVFLIMPATANIIGKIASGIADDLLSSSAIASIKPIIFAPSMNQGMWNNPIIQKNVNYLSSLGHIFINECKNAYNVCKSKITMCDATLPTYESLYKTLIKYFSKPPNPIGENIDV